MYIFFRPEDIWARRLEWKVRGGGRERDLGDWEFRAGIPGKELHLRIEWHRVELVTCSGKDRMSMILQEVTERICFRLQVCTIWFGVQLRHWRERAITPRRESTSLSESNKRVSQRVWEKGGVSPFTSQREPGKVTVTTLGAGRGGGIPDNLSFLFCYCISKKKRGSDLWNRMCTQESA